MSSPNDHSSHYLLLLLTFIFSSSSRFPFIWSHPVLQTFLSGLVHPSSPIRSPVSTTLGVEVEADMLG